MKVADAIVRLSHVSDGKQLFVALRSRSLSPLAERTVMGFVRWCGVDPAGLPVVANAIAPVETAKTQKRSSSGLDRGTRLAEIRHRRHMRSELVLRSRSDGTGWEESWALSGHDESVLRGYLAKLDRYLTPAPLEHWEQSQRVIDAKDRWLAAMLLFPEDVRGANHRFAHPQFRAEQAWTAAGARLLAQSLPDELADLRTSIERRFGDSPATA